MKIHSPLLNVSALVRRAEVDPKTGLFNAAYFSKILGSELVRSEHFDRPLTVVMADLDLLGNVNRTYGQKAGDQILIEAARLLKKSFREYDVVARFGGEEFSVLLLETNPEQIFQRVESIRRLIESTEFKVQNSSRPVHVTMSFGIAGRSQPGQTADEVLHNADVALYQSKLNGRNMTTLFNVPEAGGTPTESEKANGEGIEAPTPTSTLPAAPYSETGASTQSGQETPPKAAPRPAWQINLYIAGVALVAAFLSILTVRPDSTLDWFGLLVFTFLVILAEGLSVDIYANDTAISTSAVPIIAGVLIFGAPGILALGLIQAVTTFIKHKSHTNRLFFNTGNQVIAGTLCLGIVAITDRPFQESPAIVQLLLSLVTGGLIYLSTTALIAVAIHLSSGEPLIQSWSVRFQWLAPYYLEMGIIAYTLIFSYQHNGLLGVLTILAPLLILRYSQDQYIHRTKTVVDQLRANNLEIQKRSEEIIRLNEELLLALARSIDARDPYVLNHSQHVARYASKIAHQIGLPPERVDLVHKAGLLHDIGKQEIPESILIKPSKLNQEEFEIIKKHSVFGARIMKDYHSLHEMIPLILHHHERFDGKGYPYGLAGNEIPIEARILSLADAIEAMASDRPYKRAMDGPAILDEIQRCAGSQFDPLLVEAFVKIIERQGMSTIVNSTREIMLEEQPGEKIPAAYEYWPAD